MLIINDASAAGVAYWQRSAVHSTWLGLGAAALGLSGPVDGDALGEVLRGRRPGGGALAERPGLRRRHGWDLVFAAPKSVSLLALSEAVGADSLRLAFRDAVADAFTTLEQNAAYLRRRGEQVPARGVVAGAFEHAGSDARQPHLHAHVVLANLGDDGQGRWGCLVGNELWRWRDGLGPAFHLALRSRLTTAGFGFEWELGAGGAGEIAAVTRAQRSAASTRSLAARASARSFGSVSAGTARVAQARGRLNRPGPVPGASPEPSPEPSREPSSGPPAADAGLALAGLSRRQATDVLRAALAWPALPSPPPAPSAVEQALAGRGSTFTEPDVVAALAETAPRGLSRSQVSELCRLWCGHRLPAGTAAPVPALSDPGPSLSDPVPSLSETGAPASRRWTTALARRLDTHIVDVAVEARFAHLAQVSPALAWPELEALGIGGQAAEVGSRLACSGEGVSVVPPGPWLAQAACVDAARAIWQAAGISVSVSSPSELSGWRWRALTSLQPATARGYRGTTGYQGDGYGRGVGGTLTGGRVLVVDAANHLGPVALAQLLDQAALSHTKLVLVGGGTVPGRGPSRARSFDQLVDAFAPYKLGPPATAPGYRRPASAHPSLALEGIVVRGALTGADALAQVVAGWQAVAAAGTGRALMVAFGPAEVEALNLAARVARSSPDRGPELVLGDRGYVIGDEVLALRRIGTVRSATPGTVVEVGPSSLAVHWRDGPKGQRTTIDRSHASSLGYGYATTVPYLRGLPAGPSQPGLLVLGDPLCLAARSSLVVAAWVTLAGPGSPALGPNGPAARRRAGIAELATGWPDSAMLQRAGPRPLNSGAHRRWANLVTDCALEREFGLSRPALPGPGPELGHRSARAGRDGVSPAWPTSGASPRLGL